MGKKNFTYAIFPGALWWGTAQLGRLACWSRTPRIASQENMFPQCELSLQSFWNRDHKKYQKKLKASTFATKLNARNACWSLTPRIASQENMLWNRDHTKVSKKTESFNFWNKTQRMQYMLISFTPWIASSENKFPVVTTVILESGSNYIYDHWPTTILNDLSLGLKATSGHVYHFNINTLSCSHYVECWQNYHERKDIITSILKGKADVHLTAP